MTTRSRICSVGLTCAPLGKREGPKKPFYFRLDLKEDKSHPHSPQNKITVTADTPALHPALACCAAPAYCHSSYFACAVKQMAPEFFSLPILPLMYSGMTLNKAAAANIRLPLLLFVSVSSESLTLYSVATVKQRGTELRQKTSGLHYTRSIPAA